MSTNFSLSMYYSSWYQLGLAQKNCNTGLWFKMIVENKIVVDYQNIHLWPEYAWCPHHGQHTGNRTKSSLTIALELISSPRNCEHYFRALV